MTVSINTPHKLTPMMEQYRSVKKTLPEDTVLFFRLGDFYEMFFEDAVKSSEILNITLTGRESAKVGRIPMCGIPYHAFHGYVGTLIAHNLKVAVCEQVGDPKAKGLVERKVTRIVSPATYLEGEEGHHQFAYLVAVAMQGDRYAVSQLELSTGEFSVRELAVENLLSELTLLNPREVILPQSLCKDESLVQFIKGDLGAALTQYEDWVFAADEGLRLLMDAFSWGSKQSVPFYENPLAVASTGAILYYLRDHHHHSIGHLQAPQLIETKAFMSLDRQTQRSLELVSALSGDKQAPTLLTVLDQTLTSMGSRSLRRWVTHPLLTVEEIQRRQAGVECCIEDVTILESIRQSLKGVRDMERALSRLNYGVANARDLVNLRRFLERVPDLQQNLRALQPDLLKEMAQVLVPQPKLLQLITDAIVEEPPLAVKEGGVIRDQYHPGLDELRGLATVGKNWLLEFERRESERTGIKKLKIKYSQVFGYTIEISKANLQSVPEDYVRRQTLANAERFVTPELKEWDEKISGAQDKIKQLEYELFDEVRQQVLQQLRPLQAMARAIGELDAIASLASVAQQKAWVRPSIDQSRHLHIQGGRHPVVDALLPFGEFVENDTLLNDDKQQLVVLTGPNMAGKSTYIRQTALLVILAQIGSYVPAEAATIGLVDRIFTRIGASDDLAKGESTFMVEMVEMAHILQKASDASLLVLDEVGRGTATFDGVSIAWAICEYLTQSEFKPRTLFATHYHELTQLADHFPSVQNFHMSVRDTGEGIHFLRKVKPGAADRSYGIHVAQLAGLPSTVTQRAEAILQVLEAESTEATQIIEAEQIKAGGQPAKTKPPAPSPQADLFTWGGEEHPVVEALGKLDVNGMTPLDALNWVSKMKEKL